MNRTLLRQVLAVAVAVPFFGLSFGVLATAAGLPLSQICALSLLVFAGGAQFAVVGVIAAGGAAAAAVAAGLLLNSRYLAFGVVIARLLDGPLWRRALGAQLMTDESAALALAEPDPHDARQAFWLTGGLLYLLWNASTLAGALLGSAIGDPAALGLDAAFPAGFLALLGPLLRDRGSKAAAATGALLVLALTPLLPPGIPILVSALGALAGLALRRDRKEVVAA
jgi:predicted branched-subunit amino acid permease